MEFTREIIENLFENLNKTPQSIREPNSHGFEVYFKNNCGNSLRIIFYRCGRVGFTASLNYLGYFDANDVKFFDSINARSWDIDRQSINFVVKVKDKKELEEVTRKAINKYFYC